MIKRIIAAITVAALALSLCACGGSVGGSSQKDENKLSIVTTIFPQYNWVKEILGDESTADVKMLLDNGVDLHSYQPTTDDIITVSECDVFIYVGGESDVWVNDVLKDAVNKDMKVINMMEVLGETVKEEEVVEGMESEEEESDEEEPEYDEHIWLSVKNADKICGAICDALCEVDSGNKDKYKANSDKYRDKLEKLDGEYSDMIKGAKRNIILFGDRFPFRYLVDDYGIEYYAAFVGCSAETEASFETVVFLSGKVDELKLPAVLVLEKTDKSLANTIIDNTTGKDAEILTLNSIQSVTSADLENGLDYISIMEDNLSVLEKALN